MDKEQFLQRIKGQLIVSCQALEHEPLHGSLIMAKMAAAAREGGAAAIRANGKDDVAAIRRAVALPVIGLVKRNYPDSEVYITPTVREIDELIEAGAEVIALDATNRTRPDGISLRELIGYIRSHSRCLIMADISTEEEGVTAEELGVDLVSTTMSGYTDYSPQLEGPDFELIARLAARLNIPLIGEGRINTPEEAVDAMVLGAHAVVVGSAITRPQLITKRFVDKIREGEG